MYVKKCDKKHFIIQNPYALLSLNDYFIISYQYVLCTLPRSTIITSNIIIFVTEDI